MAKPAPSYGNFLIFPPCIKKAGAGREHKTDVVENDASEIFVAR